MPILEELNSFKDAVSGCRPTFAREDVKRRGLSQRRKGAKHAKPENKNISRRRGDAEARREDRRSKFVLTAAPLELHPTNVTFGLFLFPFSPFVLSLVETLFIWKVRRSARRVRDSSARTDPPSDAGCLANPSQTSRRHRP